MSKIKARQFKLKNGQELEFRSISQVDAQTVLDLRRQIPIESNHTLHYIGMPEISVEESKKRIEKNEQDPFCLYIGAFDGPKIVGSLQARRPHDQHPWCLHTIQFGMTILKEFWGLSIGTRLLELLEEFSKNHGMTRIEAQVRTTNEAGLKLYSRCGYKIEGKRVRPALIHGEFHDEYFIAKLLDDPNAGWRPPVLKTARLIVRPLEISDAPSIFNYAKNPNVSLYTLWEPHRSVEDSLSFIKDYAFPNYAEQIPEPMAICFKENPDQVIGSVGAFWGSKKHKFMELGYALGESHWGQGIITEATQAVIDYCFDAYQLKRIQARCKTENIGSAKVMEKLGMQHEGVTRSALFHRNRYWDMHTYAIIR